MTALSTTMSETARPATATAPPRGHVRDHVDQAVAPRRGRGHVRCRPGRLPLARPAVVRLRAAAAGAGHLGGRLPARPAGRGRRLQPRPRPGDGRGVAGIGLALGSVPIAAAGAILVAHSGMDRMAGYGLKLPTSFQDTHLGRIGRDR